MPHVYIERDGPLCILKVDRPRANAFDLALAAELIDALQILQADPCRAIVLAGRPGFFSAGIDIKAAPTYNEAERQQMVDAVQTLIGGFYRESRPVVTAITGHAAGGGLILALCGDHRVCTDDPNTKLSLPEVQIGVPFPEIPMEVVRKELSATAARKMALCGAALGPAEALQLGIIDTLAPADQVIPRAISAARQLAALPSEVYAQTKRALRDV